MKKIILLLFLFICTNLSSQYKVDKSRIESNFYNLKKFGNNVNEGNDRVAYSDFDIQARIYLTDKLKGLGKTLSQFLLGRILMLFQMEVIMMVK